MATVVTGSCNCGGVQLEITGPLRPVVACHCSQCRKQTGHFVAATRTRDMDIEISDSGTLKWYAASDDAKRGFCSNCGSALFWKSNGSDQISVMAGVLDGAAGGIKLDRHIFVADKGDYYEITDDVPLYPQAD